MQVDMFPQTRQNISTPSFPSTQPCLLKAAPRDCGCVSTNSCANKNTRLSGISTVKKHIRQMAKYWKALYSSRFSTFYLLFTFVINTTHSTCVGAKGQWRMGIMNLSQHFNKIINIAKLPNHLILLLNLTILIG